MSGLWRSQEMRYCSIMMRSECANDTLAEIGEHGFFHPVDLSDPLDLSESAKAAKKRIDECRTWANRLQRFRELMNEFAIKIPTEDYTEEKGGDRDLLGSGDILEALKRHVDPREEELVRNIQFQRQTKQEIVKSIEHQHVLKVVATLQLEDELDEKGDALLSPSYGSSTHTMGTPLLGADHGARAGVEMAEVKGQGTRFHSYICGVINQASQPLFARMLFRVSRGNAISGFAPIVGGIVDGSDADNPVPKSVFYIMLTGQQLRDRITRLCANFEASIYQTPQNREGFERKLAELERKTSDQKAVLQQTEFAIVQLLQTFAGTSMSSPLHTFELALRKEKAINITLMKCRFTYLHSCSACMIYMEGWCPKIEVHNLRDRLSLAFRNVEPAPVFNDDVVAPGAPPTYFRTNKFTSVYQGLVDTYGVARYQEVNPGLFTIVTFPFLFGVMYGDFGHGIFLTLFASYLIFKEDALNEQKKRGEMNEILVMIFGGRYMLILMGLFAIYVGTIYNDCMAIPLHLFDTMWHKNSTTQQYERIPGRVYPWGIDYEWYNKKNELFFFNSLKMKMSVILGVTQMLFGVALKACNHIYFKEWVALLFEFIPQLLFLTCTFGYMCLMIIIKWATFWPYPALAPNLIQTMIGMFLSPGSLPTTKVDGKEVEMPLFAGQAAIQVVLVLIAVACVPVMLLVKPCMEHKANQRRALRTNSHFSIQDDGVVMEMAADEESPAFSGGHGPSDGHDHEEHSLSDLMIHQAIHTIEFVLGCVSNTASYLRLWALSLAHAQLATVFWEKMMMDYGIVQIPYIGAVVGFAAWFAATFFVLLCMDVLECFLHALRLHWVEFQNKFYRADGYAFTPFTFAKDDSDY